MENLKVKLGPLELKTIYGRLRNVWIWREYASLVNLQDFGALVVKGLTLKPRQGNPSPRIVETPAGMLNAIGLQNPGLDVFLSRELPRLKIRSGCNRQYCRRYGRRLYYSCRRAITGRRRFARNRAERFLS